MFSYKLSDIALAVGGRLIAGQPDLVATCATQDSRTARPGSLFFALPGERTDGHDFLASAACAGAVASVISNPDRARACLDDTGQELGLILVDEVPAALSNLAAWHRRQIPETTVVGVTGSAGKTTTKDMIASVIGSQLPTVATRGNMNNEIGVPLTMLEVGHEHSAAVIEMGMRGFGQIDALTRITLPDIGVITNIGDAHIELLGSRENIAAAKSELIRALPPSGAALLNGDDPHTRAIAEQARGKVSTVMMFGLDSTCDLVACDVRSTGDLMSFAASYRGKAVGNRRFEIPLPGAHNVYNALAAVGVGLAMGLDPDGMAEGLKEFRPSAMRMRFMQSLEGYTVIDDTYNANPASMKCAIDAACQHAEGRRVIAVIGDMLELGEVGPGAHREVGRYAQMAGVTGMVTFGELSQFAADEAVRAGMNRDFVFACQTREDAAKRVLEMAMPGDVVLVKGSRGMMMDEIVSMLIPDDEEETGDGR